LARNAKASTFLKSRWYPALPQALTAWVFAIITWQLLAGSSNAAENMGSIYTWVLWWPILPLLFLATGRFWCAVCPFGLINDLVQKAFGRNEPVPMLMKKYGVWAIDVMFVLITWADHVFGIFKSPLLTGGLMLVIITGVVVSGAVWQRRAWCRYLCFLGGLAGNYARNGMVELRATPEVCSKCKAKAACFNGTETVPPCPVFEFPRMMATSANCNLCGNCVKSCPNDSIHVRLRPPSKEIYTARSPKFEEAFLAIVIMGIVFVKNTSDTAIWDSLLQRVEAATHTGFAISFTLIFLVAVNIPGIVLTLMSLGARYLNGDSWRDNLTKFGYALIPLDMAAVLAHTCIDILSQGRAIVYAVLGLFGIESGDAARGLVSVSVVTVVQIGLIVIGAAGSLYAVYRIAHFYFDARGHTLRTILPYSTMIAGFAAINIYIFSLTKEPENAGSGVAYVAHGFNQALYAAVLVGSLVLVSMATVWVRSQGGQSTATKKQAHKAQVSRAKRTVPRVDRAALRNGTIIISIPPNAAMQSRASEQGAGGSAGSGTRRLTFSHIRTRDP
jgi:polyferredoxin